MHYNLFDLRAEEVTIDLLSDSGTGALSSAQLAVGMAGGGTAGSRSFYRFRDAVAELTGFSHILQAHQGRAAERPALQPPQARRHRPVQHALRHHPRQCGAGGLCGPRPALRRGAEPGQLEPFKGNIDLEALERGLTETTGSRVAAVVMTITNNGGGGQPVSMENLRRTSELCRRHGVPPDPGRRPVGRTRGWSPGTRRPTDRTPRQVAEEAFRLADGCVMSAKKDGIVGIGGFIGLNDPELAQKCELLLIATEGFPACGGLAGRDLDMIAQGLQEVTEPSYLGAGGRAPTTSASGSAPPAWTYWSHPVCTPSISTRAGTTPRTRPTSTPATLWPAALLEGGMPVGRTGVAVPRRGGRGRKPGQEPAVRAGEAGVAAASTRAVATTTSAEPWRPSPRTRSPCTATGSWNSPDPAALPRQAPAGDRSGRGNAVLRPLPGRVVNDVTGQRAGRRSAAPTRSGCR